jgi:hypothetical protein
MSTPSSNYGLDFTGGAILQSGIGISKMRLIMETILPFISTGKIGSTGG